VGLYVTLFAVGHSVTLLFGVLTEISISSYIIDAIIGFSVVYKAMDNLGPSSAGSVISRTPKPRRSSSACCMALAWQQRSRSTKSRPTA
jgi:hypothetical protein